MERENEARREAEEFVAEAGERLNEHKEAKTRQHNEMQNRKQKTLDRIRSKELPEERDEREMWAKFIEEKNKLDESCPFGKLDWRVQTRQTVWMLVDKLKEMHDFTMTAQEVRKSQKHSRRTHHSQYLV